MNDGILPQADEPEPRPAAIRAQDLPSAMRCGDAVNAAQRLREAHAALQEPALPRHRRTLLPLQIACLRERAAIEEPGYAAGESGVSV